MNTKKAIISIIVILVFVLLVFAIYTFLNKEVELPEEIIIEEEYEIESEEPSVKEIWNESRKYEEIEGEGFDKEKYYEIEVEEYNANEWQ